MCQLKWDFWFLFFFNHVNCIWVDLGLLFFFYFRWEMSLTRTLVYISGRRNNAGTQILLPLPSAAVLFLVHYCDCNLFELVFVDEETSASECVSVSFAALLATKHTFTDKHSCPYRCDLPVVCDDPVIRSGLCSSLRCLIKKCHANDPEKNLHDLLVSKYLCTFY